MGLVGLVCFCGEIWGWCMVSHSHGGGFNMALCYSCGKNLAAHTETDVQTRCKPKKQRRPQADMWCAVKSHTHIKSTEQKFDTLKGELAETNKRYPLLDKQQHKKKQQPKQAN